MKKILLFLFIVMSGAMTATTLKNRDAGPTDVVVTTYDSACGLSDGSITFGAVTGGVAPYTYSIDGGTTYNGGTVYTGLSANAYALAVKDSNGDVYSTSVTITDSPGPTAITTTVTNTFCGADDGSVKLGAVTGGVAPYTYSFDYSGFTAQTFFSNLPAGFHVIDVKDANGCNYLTSVEILNNPGPTDIATIINTATCGTSDGSLSIGAVTGGTTPYTYNFNALGFSLTTSYTGLASGSYPLDVKDANGCVYTTTVSINNTGGSTAIATTFTNTTCGGANGCITLGAVTGGTAPYLYDIGNPADGVFDNGINNPNLPAGSYTVSVKDANGCIYSTIIHIGISSGPTAVDTTIVNATCGQSNGTITLGAVTGGVAPYYYMIDGSPFSSSIIYTGLSIGSYTLTVKDYNDCLYTTTFTITNQFNGVSDIATTVVTASCGLSDGSISIDGITGGVAPYSYAFDNGVYGTTTNFTNLSAGNHSISVKDSNGCILSKPFNFIDILGLTMTGLYNDYNADGYTNVGDVINYQFTVKNCNPAPLTNITLYDDDPSFIINGAPIASLAPGSSDNSNFTATYVINQNDINSGHVSNGYVYGSYTGSGSPASAFSNVTLNLSDGIKLNAFIDSNGNGIQDGGEVNFYDGEFHYEINSNGIINNISSYYGQYPIYESNPANLYNISFNTNNPNYTVNPASFNNITVANGSGITTYNFPVTFTPYTDLRVSIFPNGIGPRPGFTYQNQILINNIGNQTIPSGTLIYTKDNRVTITNVSPSATMTGTGFTYNYPSLAPSQSVYVYVTMQIPTIPTVNLGDLLTNSVSVDIPSGDINSTDNSMSLTQEVRGSYDPNDKVEAHGPQIVHSTFTSNDYLSYTIQFENTGTANAITVRVNDVLDSKLDETTIKTINASHPFTLDRVGNDLTWHFDGIDLPPSVAGTSTGKGYINFQIKPKTGYAVGDIIINTAYIYFDFNPTIVTNPFSTEFVTALGVKGFVNNQFSAYPNPTTGVITIALKNSAAVIDVITVTDVLGKTVLSNTINNSNATVDLSHLSKGLYFVKIQTEGQVNNLKVIKE